MGSAEAISWRDELSCAAINPRFQTDLDLARDRLKHEFDRFDDLHNMTKEFVVGAELWSNNHWISISPWIAPLRWAQAIESEFHNKVYMCNRTLVEGLLKHRGKDAPREGQGCTLGQIIEVMKAKSNDSYTNYLLATLRDNKFLLSPDICIY